MTDAVKALVRAATERVRTWEPGKDSLATAIRAVESEAAREDAVEHAIARNSLEVIRAEVQDALVDREGAWTVAERDIDAVFDRHLSLLGARNFEVVSIPQGETCEGCGFDCETMEGPDFLCANQNVEPAERGNRELDRTDRKGWFRCASCRSRYGVEAKP
jgi:hypothetical protein